MMKSLRVISKISLGTTLPWLGWGKSLNILASPDGEHYYEHNVEWVI